MAYLKINDVDYSAYVNKLIVNTKQKYTQRENAAGTLLTNYITEKHSIQVGIIPLEASALKSLTSSISGRASMNVKLEFLDPKTNALKTATCIVPINSVEYYTIRADRTLTKAFNITFEEK